MISISRRLTLTKISLTCCWILVPLVASGVANQQLGSEFGGNQLAVNHHNIPGHYEFEVAPKMEPPVVRKPPYPQSAQFCPGSTDPFARFSPANTLCGDLNQGRVPMNPLGQMIDDQSYPFELIKNKTLQFLARALPVLKLEYETIPKVARYLPANHLLNPTHQASPLASDHLQQINQRLAASGLDASAALVDQFDQHMQQAPPIYLRRRRRSAAAMEQSRIAAELVSNANIVVKSAHTGQIHSLKPNRNDSSLVGVVITKDRLNKASSASKSTTQKPLQQQQHQQVAGGHNGYNWAQSGGHNAAPISEASGGGSGKLAQQQRVADASLVATAATEATLSANSNNGDRKQRNGSLGPKQQEHSHLQPLTVTASANIGEIASNHANHPHLDDANKLQSGERSPAPATNSPRRASNDGQGSGVSGAASSKQTARNRAAANPTACGGESASMLTSVICQMTTAFIDGNSQAQPAWLQMAKQLGAVYSGSSSDSSSLFSSPTLWSLLSSLNSGAGTGSANPQKSSPTSSGSDSSTQAPALRTSGATTGLMSIIGPIASLLMGSGGDQIQAKESNNKEQPVSIANSISNSPTFKLAVAGWTANAIYKIAEYFVPSVFQSISSSGNDKGFAKRKKPFDPQEQFVDTPASMAANLKQQTGNGVNAAPGKQPPTPCPSVEEYISPTFARNYQGAWKYVVQIPHEGYFTQTIQRTSCVRQRCEFTDGVCHESPRWVSLLVAEIYYPNMLFGQAAAGDQSGQLNSMQPQQSVPSHHQMATSSSTSSIQQVALNAPALSAQQQATMRQLQQPLKQNQQHQNAFAGSDPLQMTDSTYNNNLQNAFINVANELGWDPNNVANMQHLANAYNYQLMQRSGLSPGNQPTLESRAGSSGVSQAPANFMQQTQQPTSSHNDYIMALAEATLRENPNMSIQDLILSLRQQTAQMQQLSALNRKRRDTSNLQQTANAVRRQQVQPRSGLNAAGTSVENPQSVNDISSPNLSAGTFSTLTKQQVSALQQQQHQQGSSPLQAQLMAQHQAAGSPEVGQTLGNGNQNSASSSTDAQQTIGDTQNSGQECDGHDKLGCYVVRVYYDWFLVNGSCKCWKTGSQTGGQTSGSQSSGLLRRIFTG